MENLSLEERDPASNVAGGNIRGNLYRILLPLLAGALELQEGENPATLVVVIAPLLVVLWLLGHVAVLQLLDLVAKEM